MEKLFFESQCKVFGIPLLLGKKIIDGRYKPYLSVIDDQYYKGNSLYDTKSIALMAAIKKYGEGKVLKILKSIK